MKVIQAVARRLIKIDVNVHEPIGALGLRLEARGNPAGMKLGIWKTTMNVLGNKFERKREAAGDHVFREVRRLRVGATQVEILVHRLAQALKRVKNVETLTEPARMPVPVVQAQFQKREAAGTAAFNDISRNVIRDLVKNGNEILMAEQSPDGKRV
jgi:hypothetical protein